MSLITGTPPGTITSPENTYPEGAPNIWFQDDRATGELNSPDSDGFYWGLSGTSTYPLLAIGCVEGVNLADNLLSNTIQCDTVGVVGQIQRRNFMELNFTLKTPFPLSILTKILHGGPVTASGHVEKMGLGTIDNSIYYRAYLAKVYNENIGAYVNMTIHKAQFVDAWTLNMRYGNEWTLTGLKLRAFARDTLPAAQQFMTWVRADTQTL
jgi:hypothetical protein